MWNLFYLSKNLAHKLSTVRVSILSFLSNTTDTSLSESILLSKSKLMLSVSKFDPFVVEKLVSI